MRTPLIAGNWKMNLGRPDEAQQFVRSIRGPLHEIKGVDRVLCPPFTALAAVAELLGPTDIGLAAQNMHFENSGAQTGEVSAAMLADLCQYVILGHSERRAAGGQFETEAAIHRKLQAALDAGLTPILCVGQNLQQNEAGQTHEFVGGQVRAGLQGLSAEQAARCVIAYEPIWAIGTGRAATPADANRVMGLTVRGALADLFGEEAAGAVRILYGGSVTAGNIAGFLAMPEIDGALVGGASLKPDFVELVRRAATAQGLSGATI
jgi:triosephosphate isomerase